MGPDGAKGDRGEPGMTVSAYRRAHSEDADIKRRTRTQHVHRVNIELVFVNVFCLVSSLFLF